MPNPGARPPDEPIDLAALRADDELIDALAAGDRAARDPSRPDAPLVELLAAWADDLAAAEPVAAPTVRSLTAAAAAGPPPAVESPVGAPAEGPAARARADRPALWRVAVAAAAAALVLTGSLLGVETARPGDGLWPLAVALQTERAQSVEAADEVGAALDRARAALREGRPDTAELELAGARDRLPGVGSEEGGAELQHQERLLTAVLETLESTESFTVAPGSDAEPDGAARSGPSPDGSEPAVAGEPPVVASEPPPGGTGEAQPSSPGATEDPGATDPDTTDPGIEDPSTEDPGTEDPGTEDPGTEDPGTEDPGTEDPGTEDPGTEDPSTEDPSTEDPGTEDPDTTEQDSGGGEPGDAGTGDAGAGDDTGPDAEDPGTAEEQPPAGSTEPGEPGPDGEAGPGPEPGGTVLDRVVPFLLGLLGMRGA